MAASARVGVDIGGTFTDLVLIVDGPGAVLTQKVLTRTDAPEESVLEGLRRLLHDAQLPSAALGHVTHGTTLVTNALIERKGATTALLSTAGFRDVIEIGREGRYDLDDLSLELPAPLVPRHRRFEVTERMLFDGSVYQELEDASVTRLAPTLRALGVEAVAISFLHSYVDPRHERRVAEILADLLPGVYVSISAEVSPQIREYERTSTVAANAYVGPNVSRYIERLERGLRSEHVTAPLYVMLSSGGLTTPATARRFPIRLLESGPAAGAILAAYLGHREGVPSLLSFDMGGTTAKACVIEGSRPLTTSQMEVARVWRFKKGSGLPVNVPVVDMIEIGAGGGSIARLNELGTVEVGPDSAGADPGPACYGRGGDLPTVTDADLVLGYLDPEYFLGGEMALDVEHARCAIERLARPLGVSVVEAAWWVHRIVAENMAAAARMHAAERAVDLRALPLFAFGGAGPVHALSVARLLRSRSVIVPPGAGVGSAIGFLAAPVSFEISRSLPARLAELDWASVRAAAEEMAREAVALVSSAPATVEKVAVRYRCSLRHVGQGFEIDVDLPSPQEWDPEQLDRRFRDRYRAIHGVFVEGVPLEVTTWSVVAATPITELPALWTETAGAARPAASRQVFRQDLGRMGEATVYDRRGLGPGWSARGPLLIEETGSTIVVPVEADVRVSDGGSIVIDGFAS